jgi:hypothetical protein
MRSHTLDVCCSLNYFTIWTAARQFRWMLRCILKLLRLRFFTKLSFHSLSRGWKILVCNFFYGGLKNIFASVDCRRFNIFELCVDCLFQSKIFSHFIFCGWILPQCGFSVDWFKMCWDEKWFFYENEIAMMTEILLHKKYSFLLNSLKITDKKLIRKFSSWNPPWDENCQNQVNCKNSSCE